MVPAFELGSTGAWRTRACGRSGEVTQMLYRKPPPVRLRPLVRIAATAGAGALAVACGSDRAGGAIPGLRPGVPRVVADSSVDEDATTVGRPVSTAPYDAGDVQDAQATDGCGGGCPAREPNVGDVCGGTSCAYPIDAGAGCLHYYECFSRSLLEEAEFQGVEMECPAQNGAACPATAADVAEAGTCDPVAPPCEYPGTVCQCLGISGPADASDAWHCITVPPDCPQMAPLLGSACSPAGQNCAYGANPCTAQGFGFFTCSCGVWRGLPVPPCAPP
jgi:hypothetical protein